MQRLMGSQVFDRASTSLSHNDGYKLAHVMFETRILSLQKVALIHRPLATSNIVNSSDASQFPWLQHASMTGGP